MNSPDLLQLFIAAAVMGAITAYFAKQRGREPGKWFIIGFLAGVFGLLALFMFPKEEPKKETPSVPPAPVPDALASKSWYYLDAQHNTLGPQTLDQLKTLYREQKISLKTFVWCEGMQGWKRIEEMAELENRFM